MKRTGRILSLIVIMVMLAASVCFAAPAGDTQGDVSQEAKGTLNLLDTYPRDGSKGASIENMSVKLYFDSEFTEKVLKNKNDDAIQFVGPDGKKLPTRILYSVKEKGVVLVIVDNDEEGKIITGEGNSEYTLKISKDLTDDAGSVLGKDMSISFTTLNQKANTLVNMGMMFAMFGAMMVMSMKSAKKAAEEQQKARKEEKVNPYKEAKRTGKTVEEIVEQDQRNKAKQAEKEARKAAKEAEKDDYEYIEEGVYRVKGPRPIAAAGGKYVTGRKAAAEAKKAEEEARKARQQQNKAKKGKGKKKK